MSKITRQKRKDNFTVVNNDILQNSKLSWAAKGMLVYLLHLPDGWQINVADLWNRSKNGRDATAAIIKELIQAGYVTRTKVKGEKNLFKGYDYTVSDEPTVNGFPVDGKSVFGDSVNGNPEASKDYQKEELSKERTKDSIEEPQKENEILTTVHDQVDETAVKVVELIPSTPEQTQPPNSEAPPAPKKWVSKEEIEERKTKRKKYIHPPTIEELVQPIYEKLLEKKRQHPNIVDCWNNANMQAEKFHIHWEEKGWKIEKLNLAVAKWINNSISYGQVTKPCPIQYKGNPANAQPVKPTKVHVEQPVLTQQDIEASEQHFAGVRAMFKQMGV